MVVGILKDGSESLEVLNTKQLMQLALDFFWVDPD